MARKSLSDYANIRYKLIAYTKEGKEWKIMRSGSIERLDRYKHKENYRIVILDNNEIIYDERR